MRTYRRKLLFYGRSVCSNLCPSKGGKIMFYGNREGIQAALATFIVLVCGFSPFRAGKPAAKDDQSGISRNVICLALTSDGKSLVTGSIDGTASLWELPTGKEVRTFRGHTGWHASGKLHGGAWTLSSPGWVTSVAISEDGKLLATGSFDKTARLWDMSTARQLRTFPHPHLAQYVNLSPDGKWLVTGSADNIARLWDLAKGKEIRAFRGHTDGVVSVAVSGDAKKLATASVDGTAPLSYMLTGQRIHTFAAQAKRRRPLGVTVVAFSKNGKWLATGSEDHTARLWDLETGKEVRVFRGHTNGIGSVAFSNDGKWLVTGSFDQTARLG